MTAFVASLFRSAPSLSTVWLHDGLLMSPCPSQAQIVTASHGGLRAVKLPERYQAAKTPLLPPAAHCALLPAMPGGQFGAKAVASHAVTSRIRGKHRRRVPKLKPYRLRPRVSGCTGSRLRFPATILCSRQIDVGTAARCSAVATLARFPDSAPLSFLLDQAL